MKNQKNFIITQGGYKCRSFAKPEPPKDKIKFQKKSEKNNQTKTN